jgi:CO/xanthine dehydrogenase Mo-binding subunit
MTVPPNPSLENNPLLDRWLAIGPDGRVLVRSGKVELGQGLLTALAQIVADELDVAPERVAMVPAATDTSPDEAYTAGSLSVQHSGTALRAACATVRALFLEAAASRLGAPVAALTVADGEITAPGGGRTSYWELADAVPLDGGIAPGSAGKDPAGYAVIGRSLPRLDVPDKVAGRPRFIHDLRPPGMLFGRVLRPPSRRAVLRAVDDAAARGVPGVVAVVRDGSFLGVVAEREENALRALAALRAACSWEEADSLPDERDLAGFLTTTPAEETVLADTTSPGAPARGARRVRARFTRPFLAHGSIAPSCGLARWDGGRLTVWSHSQGVYKLRAAICRSLGLAAGDVVVRHVEGAGCYGHNAADDAAYDAVLLARAVPGRTVQVVWTREDELAWGPLGPAMVVDIEAEVDAGGRVCCWRQDIWSNGHASRPASPGFPPLLAATTVEDPEPEQPAGDPPMQNGGGSGRNAVPLYDLPEQLVRTHRLQRMPLRTSAMRALGAHLNVFAIESVVDELAELRGADPVEYRLGMLRDERARDVLRAAAGRAGWPGRPEEGRALGVGVARYKNRGAYCAVVADVEAEAELRVRRLTVAVDVGLVINPDGVVNQIEGGALQALSWTVKERVRFDARNVTSRTWEDYPILTFSEVPPVDVVLLDRPGEPALGAGEASIGPTAAAIGNALAAAIGVRVRALPLTRENIVAAIDG